MFKSANASGTSVRVRADCACMRVCGSSSGLLKACWEACHCKSGKGKSPKCTEERTHHPPLSLSVSLSPLLPRSLLLSLMLIYTTPLLQYFLQFYENVTLRLKAKRSEHKKKFSKPYPLQESLFCMFAFYSSSL